MVSEDRAPPRGCSSLRWDALDRGVLTRVAAQVALLATLLSLSVVGVASAGEPVAAAGSGAEAIAATVAMPRDETSVQRKARLLLRLAEAYERAGQLEDAESVYVDATTEGTEDVSATAVAALIRLTARSKHSPPDPHLELGALFESHGRLADAEVAYAKAAESPSTSTRHQAMRSLERVVGRRESVWQSYVFPAWRLLGQSVVAAATTVTLLALAYFSTAPVLSWVGRRRGRRALHIDVFRSNSLASAVGGGFGQVLTATHHRMSIHYRNRVFLRNSTLPTLVRSQSSDLVDLVSAAAPFAGSVVGRFAQRAHRPAFRISGHVDATMLAVAVFAQLEHRGSIIHMWRESFPIRTWFTDQHDLGYRILLHLKEYSGNAH